MGGQVWVESDGITGSRFLFTLRVGLPQATAGLPGLRADRPAGFTDLPVLLVDDSPRALETLERYARELGMDPASAGDAGTALALVAERESAGRPFRLALVDARMPQPDGFTLAEDLRARSWPGSATIMMVQTDDLVADARRCRKLELAGYLVKPIMRPELADAARRALGGLKTFLTLENAPAPRSIPTQLTGSLWILLAEDNLINQKVAVRLLENQGHRVRVVADGRQAVAAMAEESFDLVLMDVQMPVMSGLEATALIREHEVAAAARSRTRRPDPPRLHRALRHGEDRLFLFAPVPSLERLTAAVESWVSAGAEPPPAAAITACVTFGSQTEAIKPHLRINRRHRRHPSTPLIGRATSSCGP